MDGSAAIAERSSGGKRLLGVLALIVGSLVFGVLALEVALRLAGISYPVFETYDPVRGSKLRPGKTGWYTKEGNAFIEVNSWGYRDEERPLQKPANTFRVAVLGDSFVEARQVDLADTFWQHLERNLGACAALGEADVEVLGFGLGGHGTGQELLTLRQDALRFSPDLVLLAFFSGNDVSDNSKQLLSGRGRKGRPFFVQDGDELALDNTFRETNLVTLRQQALLIGVHYSRILEVVNQFRRVREVRNFRTAHDTESGPPRNGLNDNVFFPSPNPAWSAAWELTERLIGRMHLEAAAGGAEFAVVSLSQGIQVYPDPAVREAFAEDLGVPDLFNPERRLADMSERQGFPVISLAQPLQAIATERNLFLHGFENTRLGWGHWNEDGHRAAGDVLSQALCSAEFLAGS